MTQPSVPPPVTYFDPAVEVVARAIRAAKYSSKQTKARRDQYTELTRRDVEIAVNVVAALRERQMLGSGD